MGVGQISVFIIKAESFLRRFGLDTFILLLFFAIFLAWLFPGPGSSEGVFTLSSAANYGISVIFFFYGLRLDRQQILTGLSNVKLHILVLLGTFVFFPLFVLFCMYLFRCMPVGADIKLLQVEGLSAATLATGLWLGIFFMASLPSTVSSSVVMVNIARGNVPAAIFDACISSILGVFLTPLWMRIFFTEDTGGRDFSSIIISLILQILLPVILGLCLHRWWGEFSRKHNQLLKKFDQTVILLIVYTSFSHSFAGKMFEGLSFSTLFLLSLGMIAIFFMIYVIIGAVCTMFHFNREDRITALFCGSKKSLVHGTVMSQVILGVPTLAGILILPTMIYHALQLIIVSILAERFARQKEEENQEV